MWQFCFNSGSEGSAEWVARARITRTCSRRGQPALTATMSDEEDAARSALFGSRASRPAPPKAGNPFAEDGPAKKPPSKAASGAGAKAGPTAASRDEDEEDALRSDLFRGTSGEAGLLARRRKEAESRDDGSDGPGSQHDGDGQDIGDDVEVSRRASRNSCTPPAPRHCDGSAPSCVFRNGLQSCGT